MNSTTGNKTAYESVFGKTPYLGHVRVFGCTAYVHEPKEKRRVWNEKCCKLKLVGYDPTMICYRLYDSQNNKVIRSRNVSFDEEAEEAKKIIVTSPSEESNIETIEVRADLRSPPPNLLQNLPSRHKHLLMQKQLRTSKRRIFLMQQTKNLKSQTLVLMNLTLPQEA